jgi:uncharacterized repeat protein (TIGR01451 family)
MVAARADISPPGCTGSGLGISLFSDKTVVSAGDTIHYSALVFNTPFPACDASGISAQIVTPDGLVNPITLLRTNLFPGDSDFYSNVVAYVVRQQDASNGVLRATASDIGTIHQNTPNSTGGGFQGVDTTMAAPCVQIFAQCAGAEGENNPITFTGYITNCGNISLSGVVVSNVINGASALILGPIDLGTNQVAAFSGSWIPENPCAPSTAVFLAQGTEIQTTTPSTVYATTSATCSETFSPAIQVTQACPPNPVSPGQILVYSGTVANTGDVTLSNVVVVANQPAPNTVVFTVPFLGPGESAAFTGSYTAPAACSTSSGLVGSGTDICGVTVTGAASITCPILVSPAINVTESCPANATSPGGLLTYSGLVSNSGNITITNVVVVSDHPAANTVVFRAASLAPGASATFSGSFGVTTNLCSVTSSLTATARDICAGATVANTASSTCPIVTTPGIAVTVNCPAGPLTPGGQVTYTGVVRNTGNNTLVNVMVVDWDVPRLPTVLALPSLAPGASAAYSATFTAPADSCSVSTTVTVSGSDSCSAIGVTNSATATCALQTTPQISVTQSCPPSPASAGGVLAFSGVVSNPGNITLTNVVVLNDHTGATPVLVLPTLAPGASASFSGAYPVPANAVCSISSTVTASGADKCNGLVVSAKSSSTCPLVVAPGIQVTLACPTTSPAPGGKLTYTGTVVNNGNVPVTNIVVLGDQPAPNTVVFRAASLAPGASATFSGVFTTLTNTCSATINVTVTAGETCGGTTVMNSATAICPFTTAPGISVTVACPAGSLTPGGQVTYTGVVRNSGNNTLVNVMVIDYDVPQLPTVLALPSLAPGASAPYSATFTVPADTCSVSTTVTVTGSDSCSSISVTNSATATCVLQTAPQITVTQNCPPTPATAGGVLAFSGTVNNTGNITLTNVVIVNDHAGSPPVLVLPTLAPGASASFAGTYPVPANASCSITSTVTATGVDKCNGERVTAKSTSTCPLAVSPSIEVTLACPAILPPPSGPITYTGTVLNDGNITLTNIVVTAGIYSNKVVFTAASLAPGASATFTIKSTVPPNCCTVANTATVTAAENCGGVVVTDTDTITCNVLTSPSLTLTRACPTNAVATGELLAFNGLVSNNGNITLAAVTVIDAAVSPTQPVLGPIDLAPGQSVPYTGSFTVPADFCGTDTVTASGVNVCSGSNVVTSTQTTCPVITTPQISVTKICPPAPVPRGGLYVFSGIVSNPGNVTLTNVIVVDNEPTNPTPVLGPITLPPGGSISFTGSYTAPLCCCLIIDTLTASGRGQCDGTLVKATSTDVCPLLSSPSLSVTKICPSQPVPAGGLFSFSGSVANTGDITLTNVMVTASESGNMVAVFGPVDLAPGQTGNFSGSYTVTGATDPTMDTVIASGTDICAGSTVHSIANCLGIVPLTTQPIIGPLSGANGPVMVKWSSTPGVTYALQYKATLTDANWITLPGVVTATTTTASMTDANTSGGQRFYRVMVAQ